MRRCVERLLIDFYTHIFLDFDLCVYIIQHIEATHCRTGSNNSRSRPFIITEKQNAQPSRKGETVQAANLSAAKRKASGMQMFKGTVLEISAENGAVLSRKEGGRWTDTI